MFTYINDDKTWIFGFNKRKPSYVGEFREAEKILDDGTLTDPAKGITRKLGQSSTSMLSNTYGKENNVFVGITPDETTIALEYHSAMTLSDDKKLIKILTYDMTKNKVNGCNAILMSDGSIEYEPYEWRSQTGCAFYHLLAVALLLQSSPTSTLVQQATSLSKMTLDIDGEAAVHIDTFVNQVYSCLVRSDAEEAPFHLADVDSHVSGKFNRLTEDRIAELQLVPIWFARTELFPEKSVAPSILHLVSGEAVLKPKKTRHVAPKAASIKKLRTELKLETHDLSPEEMERIPRLDEKYVVDKMLLKCARMVKADWHCETDMAANILLQGDAGSGKTMAAQFFADVFGVPATKMTMNPMMDSSALIGAFYPVFTEVDGLECSEQDKKALEYIQEHVMCGGKKPSEEEIIRDIRRAIADSETRAEILQKCYEYPSMEELVFDTENALTLIGVSDVDPEDMDMARSVYYEKVNSIFYRLLSILTELSNAGGVSYKFVLSELLRAFQNGWLLEIQEAASVLRPGVLTELNSLLEKGGSIELPNGKRITRHPDTIVVITTNTGYAGNTELNESLKDRCAYGIRMNNPTPEVMAARAMAQVGFEDEEMAIEAATVISNICEKAKELNIKGSFGMRSLIAWMRSLKDGDMTKETFQMRVIWKMVSSEEDEDVLMEAWKNSPFASKRKKTRL